MASHRSPHDNNGAAQAVDHSAPIPPIGTVTAPTIAQVVDGVFTRFDANSDAAITQAEIVAVIDPSGTRTDAATQAAAAVAKIDTNGDSTLSKAEVTTAVTKLDTDGNGSLDRSDHVAGSAHEAADAVIGILLHPARPGDDHPAVAAVTVADAVSGIFTRFDADASTTISLTELLAVLDPRGTHTDLDARVTTLLTQLDTNGDKSLSQAEVTAAVNLLDTDHSGTLDHADMVAGAVLDTSIELVGMLLHAPHGPGF